jgi:3'-5' exoribonuclease
MRPDQPQLDTDEKILVCDLPEGRIVRTYFLCSACEVRTTAQGTRMITLTLRDASGDVKAIHFDPADDVADALTPGQVVKVQGVFSINPKYGPQLKVERLRVMDCEEYDEGTLVAVSPIPVDELAERLAALIDSVTDTHLRSLLELAVDGSREPGATFAVAPAAVRNHHAYRHGLLEHSLIVAEVAAGAAASLPAVDRDLVVAGALLHDIGKTLAYSTDPFTPGITDVGRLHGEIVLGHDIVKSLVAEIPAFPAETDRLLRHILIAHHGERAKGSPAVPMTSEAVIVHYCDDMTARVAAIEAAGRATKQGERWTQWVSMIDAPAYLGDAPELDD